MKKLFIATSIALFATTTALAMPPKPAKCPGVGALQSAKFELAQQDRDGTWVAGVLHNNFDTKDAWTFVMGKIDASSEEDAISKAETGLETLAFQTGPIAIEQYGLWACGYYTDEGYPAVTVTPALGLNAVSTLLK